jgi:hypothetical protein
VGAVFRDAWRDYRRHFADLWISSALLSLPAGLILILGGLVAARVDLPFAGASRLVLEIVEGLVVVLTPAAVALQAAALRAGGGWRRAWRDAVSRIVPLTTGYVAAQVSLFASSIGLVMALELLRRLADGQLGKVLAFGVGGAYVAIALAFFALQPVVSAVGARGGFEAVRESLLVLRRDLHRNVTMLAVAQVLRRLPLLIILLIVVPRDLPPGGWLWIAGLLRVYETLALPFVTLVALSVYDGGQLAPPTGAQ